MAASDDPGSAGLPKKGAAGESAELRAAGTTPSRFPIVGLGASAGGIEALEEFFSLIPADTGAAFVVVTHLHAGQPSLLAELLGRKTAMPVVQVDKPTIVSPNQVYTSRPGHDLAIVDGVLEPVARPADGPRRMPIDVFFRSLAEDQKNHAIGIVLSGTGSDGSLGIEAIKAEFGMVMVQDEQSARYADMPHSAIATALVDHVLPVAAMPERLAGYIQGLARIGDATSPPPDLPSAALERVFAHLSQHTGRDFSQYKQSTIRRRIERRMQMHHIDSVDDYAALLQGNPGESALLVKELLIGVTAFFRDAAAWDALSTVVVELLRSKPPEYQFRAWVAGCSTGEEAYSLAILLREAMDAIGRTANVQIFATDLDPTAVDAARAGVYPGGITSDVSAQRLARFFSADQDRFRVRKEIRAWSCSRRTT